ncbi:MAG: MMPL family transporter, partial [Crocinitomicaceae bacterium]|nr:MMPL family transporter [Crocinitomicaceae bacterium]
MRNKSTFLYVFLIFTIALAAWSLPYLKMETNLDAYSLASEEEQATYATIQEEFASVESGEMILVAERQDAWESYADFVLLQKLTQQLDALPSVLSVQSITNLRYPKRMLFITQNQPFLNLNSEAAFEKDYQGLWKYPDVANKFISKDQHHVLLFLKTKTNQSISKEELQTVQRNPLFTDLRLLPLQQEALQQEMEGLVRKDSFLLALISIALILTSFFLLTHALRGLVLIGLMISFNVAFTLLLMVIFDLPFTMHSITVPCIVIVLSFTDLMHMMYYHKKWAMVCETDALLQARIIGQIRIPMLVTSLSNIIGFVIFLVLSENELLFHFSLISILGVSIAFLSSRFLAIRLMKRDAVFLKKIESKSLNTFHERVGAFLSRHTRASKWTLFAGALLIGYGVVANFRIDGYDASEIEGDSPYLEAKKVLQTSFFGSKQMEILVKIDSNQVFDLDRLRKMERMEEWIDSVYQPLFIHSLTTVVKRYYRFVHSGHPAAYRLPAAISHKEEMELLGSLYRLGGSGLLSRNGQMTKITFGYGDPGLQVSMRRYRELQAQINDLGVGDIFQLTGKHYLSDCGVDRFTQKIVIGLMLGLAFSSLLLFLFIRSFRKSLALIFVNILPALLVLLVMLWQD